MEPTSSQAVNSPRLLLINPWIYDFAAFDLWAKPFGLLTLSSRLVEAGFQVDLLDCLDRLHPGSQAPARRAAWPPGAGQWARTVVPTPAPLAETPRHFARYGLPVEAFIKELKNRPRPHAVLVSSMMTYWYPGPALAVDLVRRAWPEVPVLLGGIYASLLPKHAGRAVGPDRVCPGPAEGRLADDLAAVLGDHSAVEALRRTEPTLKPDLSRYPRLDFAPLMTSRGCPYRCPYCASQSLHAGFFQRRPEDVLDEIEDRYFRLGLKDFAFFDDALLVDREKRLSPILEGVVRRGLDLSFHCPNGLHVGLIDRDTALLMRRAGFSTIRLGLETLDPDRAAQIGDKGVLDGFHHCVDHLLAAGFEPGRIGVYILFGLPDQDLNEASFTVEVVKSRGLRPYLAEYSPLPQTPLWPRALAASPFPLAEEPLYQNNSFFPCRGPNFSWEKVWAVKRAALNGA